MFREGFEDFQRHKSDNEVNTAPTRALKKGQEFNYTWADVRVGDLLFMK
jgi:phospholipid-translocating ATPase/phospholipid-transporting ATPase